MDEQLREQIKLRQELLLEGIASQIRKVDNPQTIVWWHLVTEEERDYYRSKALNHIEQVGWE